MSDKFSGAGMSASGGAMSASASASASGCGTGTPLISLNNSAITLEPSDDKYLTMSPALLYLFMLGFESIS